MTTVDSTTLVKQKVVGENNMNLESRQFRCKNCGQKLQTIPEHCPNCGYPKENHAIAGVVDGVFQIIRYERRNYG